ncbi:MAG: DODA-type extradiol aromatic ring-opening family dioxygenase [Novosphingobium sp.]
MPTLFLNHGGGPWPWLEGPMRQGYARLEASLQGLIASLPEAPRAILVVSGHWEEAVPTVSSAAQPPMLYDYYGFPEHTYHIRYDAPGSPALAARVRDLLRAGGMVCAEDPARGCDHGTFSLMQPIRPEADIPVVQMALMETLDPAAHIAMGRLLTPLRDEGVLVIGSGLSYHNLRAFGAAGAQAAAAFDGWLRASLVGVDAQARAAALEAWDKAPAARAAHPRAEHLLPLMVAAGAGEDDACTLEFHQGDFFGGLAISAFRFG